LLHRSYTFFLSLLPNLAARGDQGGAAIFHPISIGRAGSLSLRLLQRRWGGGIRSLRSVVRFWFCRSWSAVGVVGAASGRINLPQLHSHTGGVLHGGVSELMASCDCRFLGSAAFSFLDGVVEAEAAIPSGVSILLLCPRYYGVGSNVMVEQEG
jgi:hypothetical protein